MFESRRSLACLAATILGLSIVPSVTAAQVTVYHDRGTFTAALGSPPSNDDYESYSLGDIALGDVRGDFRYTFNPAVTQPAVVPGGNGGQALGGSPVDAFVGGDSGTLTFQPQSPTAGPLPRALGARLLSPPPCATNSPGP